MIKPSSLLSGYIVLCVLLLGTSLDQTVYQSMLRPMFGDVAFFSLRLPLGLILLSPLLALHLWDRPRPKVLPPVFGIGLILGVALLLPGFFLSLDPLLHAGGVLTLLIALLLFWWTATGRSFAPAVQQGILVSGALTSVLALAQVLGGRSLGLGFLGEISVDGTVLGAAKGLWGVGDMLRGYGLFAHPNLAFGWIALATVYAFSPKLLRPWKNPRETLLLLVLVLGLLATGAKSILLLPLAALGAYLSQRLSGPMTLMVMAVPLLLVLLLLQGLFGETASLTDRWYFFVHGVELVKHYPLGVGIGNMPAAMSLLVTSVPWMAQPVHAVLPLLFVELGVAGGLLGLLAILWVSILTFRPRSKADLRTRFLLLFILLSLCVDHYWLTSPSHLMILAIVTGMQVAPLLALCGRRRYTTG